MVHGEQDDVMKYDDITSVTPVAKILKITNTNPAKIYFKDVPEFSKFKRGERVYITRQDHAPGYELFNMQTFTLDNPNEVERSYFLKDADGKTIDASLLQFEIKDGYAQSIGDVYNEDAVVEPSSRVDAKSPSQV